MKNSTRLKDGRTVRRYSNSFKRKVLEDLETGRLTKNEIVAHYGIGAGTLYQWIKKFGRLDLYNPRMIVQMPQERDKIKALQEELAELKEALVQTQLKGLKAECDLEVALELLGVSKQEFAKKHRASHSKKPSQKGRKSN